MLCDPDAHAVAAALIVHMGRVWELPSIAPANSFKEGHPFFSLMVKAHRGLDHVRNLKIRKVDGPLTVQDTDDILDLRGKLAETEAIARYEASKVMMFQTSSDYVRRFSFVCAAVWLGRVGTMEEKESPFPKYKRMCIVSSTDRNTPTKRPQFIIRR